MQVTAKVLDDFRAHKTIRIFGIIMILNVFVSVLTDLPDFSVSTSPDTTTSTSPPVSPSVRSTSVSLPQTPPAATLRPPSACDCTGSCTLNALSATAYTDSAEQSDEER